jgi:hypothetical protein
MARHRHICGRRNDGDHCSGMLATHTGRDSFGNVEVRGQKGIEPLPEFSQR